MVMTKTTPAARKLPPAKANTDQRRMTLAECRRLLKDAERKLDAMTTDRNALQGRVAFLAERNAELQQANNTYLARARKAEGEIDTVVHEYATHVDILKTDVTYWQDESVKWAHVFADQRKAVETYNNTLNGWVTKLQRYAVLGVAIDAIIFVIGMAVWFGVLPPLFPDVPWWWK